MPRGYARTWRIEYRSTTPEMEIMPPVILLEQEVVTSVIRPQGTSPASPPVEISISLTRWQRFLVWLRRGWEVDKQRFRLTVNWLRRRIR